MANSGRLSTWILCPLSGGKADISEVGARCVLVSRSGRASVWMPFGIGNRKERRDQGVNSRWVVFRLECLGLRCGSRDHHG
jgi:hypothetical protein